MVPQLLRALRPDLRIAFFHHTAFPSADVFNMLPWRQQIIGSLLSCDYVGFHIPRYVENFVEVVASNTPAKVRSRIEAAPRFVTYGCALGVGSMATEIEVGERLVHLGAHPVGVDVDQIRALLREPEVAARTAEIRRQLGDRTAILSIERLDYVKGPLQKVQAFERLLERRPDLRGKVVLINIVTPPSSGMKVYDQLGEHLDLAVGGVNGRFGTIDWTPVRYLVRSFPFDEVVSYYAATDVAWITPLRDGLNLVAKEYVAAKMASGTEGVLILSEFAGAAVELHGALLTNPYDSTSMFDALAHALTIDGDERRERLRRLSQIVEHNDVRRWGDDFLAAASGEPS
jgi:glucosylglycerol-phosphate synthase